jgi:hypothetical protein
MNRAAPISSTRPSGKIPNLEEKRTLKAMLFRALYCSQSKRKGRAGAGKTSSVNLPNPGQMRMAQFLLTLIFAEIFCT